MEMLDVVAAENFSELLDPLVLGVDGEAEPRGPGDGDNLLQVAVLRILLHLARELKLLGILLPGTPHSEEL